MKFRSFSNQAISIKKGEKSTFTEDNENRVKMIGINFVMYKPFLIILAYTWMVNVNHSVFATSENSDGKELPSTSDECQVTPVIHVLQYPGCVPKPIPSFACIGRCSSYLQVFFAIFIILMEILLIQISINPNHKFQVSGSKIWQMERSCMCCQESGEREAAVSLFCPKAKPGERKFRKVFKFIISKVFFYLKLLNLY